MSRNHRQALGCSGHSVLLCGDCCVVACTRHSHLKSSAAGTAGKQKWSLILPSSARVSELTYVTIVGTRYPELDTFHNDIIQFGNYLQGEQSTRGGFLPIFWDAPYSYIHASTDIGEVVDWIRGKFFASTEWVAGSDGAVLSRSVTSCAGMTAYLVLLAQTRVGFLSGGRGKSFHQLTQQEQDAQKEEAFAGRRWPSLEHSRSA